MLAFRRVIALSSLFLVSCGALDMPDGSSAYRVKGGDAGPGQGSNEPNFDLAKCGFDLSKPSVNVTSRRMALTPQTIMVPGLFGFQSKYTITGSSIVEESLVRSVSAFSAGSAPTTNAKEVTSVIQGLNRALTAEILEPAARATIGEGQPEWRGVFCTLQPAKKIERGSSDRVVVEFDKPLPLSPLLLADFGRIKSEIGVKRTWNGVTAKVIESSNLEVSVGSIWTGRVVSEPVSASAQVDGPSGKVSISASLAVKMTYDFGNPQTNEFLGLPASITWFIDEGTKSLRLTQVDFGSGLPVNYLPK